jgi:hypothetical protein
LLLVIFGAGASYDASSDVTPGSNDDARIPLADHLFDVGLADIAMSYPRVNDFVTFLRPPPSGVAVEDGRHVEDLLEEFRLESLGDPDRVSELMAVRFYIQGVIQAQEHRWTRVDKGVSNYRTLFREIHRIIPRDEAIGLVTFNYDTLAERALSQLAGPFPDFDSYVTGSRWKLFKVHGSADWARRVSIPIGNIDQLNDWAVAREIVDRASEVDPFGAFVRWKGSRPQSRDEGGPLIPALAVPFSSKQDFELPPGHKQALEDILPRVTRVLIVGWRGTDKPFVDLLQAARPNVERMISVGGREPRAPITNLQRAFVASETWKHSGGFSGFLRDRRTLIAHLGRPSGSDDQTAQPQR